MNALEEVYELSVERNKEGQSFLGLAALYFGWATEKKKKRQSNQLLESNNG